MAKTHRIIAKWIKHFTEAVPAEIDAIYHAEKARAEGRGPSPLNGGTPYMEPDEPTPEP